MIRPVILSMPDDIVLDLPSPPSVNKSRKIDWSAQPSIRAWVKAANGLTMQAWAGGRRPKTVLDRFELIITLSEDQNSIDLDNGIKKLCDYCKYLGLIKDDSKKYMRRVTIEWGEAQYGCRLILRPVE